MFFTFGYGIDVFIVDVESASEVEDSGVTVSALSKEDLYRSFVRMQRRSEKYKAKFVQVMQAYKEVDRERDKLRVRFRFRLLTRC